MRKLTRNPAFRTAALALCLAAGAAASASAAPPTITNTTFSRTTSTSVRLQATLNPNKRATPYRFEYGPDDCSANPCSALPEATTEALEAPLPIFTDLSGLQPNTSYHFRLVANPGKASEVQGPDTTFKTFPIQPPFGPCKNDPFRTAQPSATLPDCRAYEQASPTDKNGLDIIGQVPWVKAANDGSAVSFLTSNGLPGGEGTQEVPAYLASRGPSGWSTKGLLPPASLGDLGKVLGWSSDFSHAYTYVSDFGINREGALLDRKSADGTITTIVPLGAGLHLGDTRFDSAPGGGSQVFFDATAALAPGAIAGKSNVYVWDAATKQLQLASALNDEQAPPQGAFAGAYDWIAGESASALSARSPAQYTQDIHAISADGSLFFTEAKTGRLFMRRNPTQPQSAMSGEECTEPTKACTVEVSASERTEPDPLGARPAAFMAATSDGKTAFFTSGEELTDDAHTGGPADVSPPAIARAELDGSHVELSYLPAHASDVAVFGDHIYWSDPTTNAIGRATLNGVGKPTEVQLEFITDAGNPRGLAVNAEYIYWANDAVPAESNSDLASDEKGTIARADRATGEGIDLDFITGASHPRGIAVDDEHIYWTNEAVSSGNGCHEIILPICDKVVPSLRTVGKATLAGDVVQQDFINIDNNRPGVIAVGDGEIFVGITNNGNGEAATVKSFDLSGEPVSGSLYDLSQPANFGGITVVANKLFTARGTTDTIARDDTKFVGNGPLTSFITGAGQPRGIAADSAYLYWAANQDVPPRPGNDLYRYQAGAEHPLTDLTPDHEAGDPNGAHVQGVLGTSADGTYVYFAANGNLDGPGEAEAGDCEGSIASSVEGALHFDGSCSLYLAHVGSIEFIARLDASGDEDLSDALNWVPRGAINTYTQPEKSSRVSPDGLTLLFRSQEKLTPYENAGTPELYRYRVGQGISCISCNPTGARPSGIATRGVNLIAIFPDLPALDQSRLLSADGNRVFFESTDALLPADSNGDEGCPAYGGTLARPPSCQDVYEWEAQGTGTCTEDLQGGGCLYLLSSGTATTPSYFLDASTDGDHAFILTRSRLVPQDNDDLYDAYDVGVGNGLASQNPATPPIPCVQEACKPDPTQPPPFTSPGSAQQVGPGDPKPARCPKGKVFKHGKCVKKQHHKRSHKNSNHRGTKG